MAPREVKVSLGGGIEEGSLPNPAKWLRIGKFVRDLACGRGFTLK